MKYEELKVLFDVYLLAREQIVGTKYILTFNVSSIFIYIYLMIEMEDGEIENVDFVNHYFGSEDSTGFVELIDFINRSLKTVKENA